VKVLAVDEEEEEEEEDAVRYAT